MKKIGIFAFLLLASAGLQAAKFSVDAIEDAIEKSNVKRVKALLRTLERKKISLKQKTNTVGALYDSAAEQTDIKEENISLIGSWRDTAKWTFGGLFSFLGLAASGAGYIWDLKLKAEVAPDPQDVGTAQLLKYAGPPVMLGSMYMFYKGITCSSQNGWLAKAREIEEHIEGSLHTLEDALDKAEQESTEE